MSKDQTKSVCFIRMYLGIWILTLYYIIIYIYILFIIGEMPCQNIVKINKKPCQKSKYLAISIITQPTHLSVDRGALDTMVIDMAIHRSQNANRHSITKAESVSGALQADGGVLSNRLVIG